MHPHYSLLDVLFQVDVWPIYYFANHYIITAAKLHNLGIQSTTESLSWSVWCLSILNVFMQGSARLTKNTYSRQLLVDIYYHRKQTAKKWFRQISVFTHIIIQPLILHRFCSFYKFTHLWRRKNMNCIRTPVLGFTGCITSCCTRGSVPWTEFTQMWCANFYFISHSSSCQI